jgi:chemotaxis protein histidine kinase CheA
MDGPTRLSFALALLASLVGCAQTGALSPSLTWMKKPAAETAAAETAKPAKTEAATKSEKSEAGTAKVAATEPPAAKEEPRPAEPTSAEPKPAATASDAPASEPSATVAEATPEAAKPEGAKPEASKPDSPTAGSSHDAATLALIEDELKHVSDEEREKLFNEWKSLDGAMVRQVIRIRQMVRELESASPAVRAEKPSATPAALPGSANPWEGPAKAIPDDTLLAQSEIQTVQHTAPAGRGSTATFGHSMTRPMPVLETLAGGGKPGVSANGPPPAPPASPAGSDLWSLQIRQLLAAAELRAEQATAGMASDADPAARRHYVESQVHLRLLYLMAGEQARAMQAIPGLEPADQEFWQQVLWGVANYFDDAALPNRSDRVTQTVEQLRSAVTRLQGEANLQLRNVAFCHKITSFGNFEKFERDEYHAGQRVLLYAELTNFKSVPQPSDGLYKTQLKSTIEIYRAGEGQAVKKIEFDPTTDLCRSYRQDYFHSYDLKLPSDLALGPHVLKLTVEDVQSGKLATYSVNFTVK